MSAPPTIAFATLGCRLNQVESQEMRVLAEQAGYRTVEAEEPAQVYVVNTCTVTSKADFSDRQTIRRITRANPEALVVVTGCLAQTDPEALARMPGIDLVVGNQEKYRLPELLASATRRSRPELRVASIDEARTIPSVPMRSVSGRSRAFVKIQDGCQHRCAFCIVPAARGRSRSQEPKALVEQIEALVDAGYGEVTLTGVDIGHYGWDLYPRTSLAALVRRIADVRGLRWLRLSSVLPAYFTPELIEAVTSLPVLFRNRTWPLQAAAIACSASCAARTTCACIRGSRRGSPPPSRTWAWAPTSSWATPARRMPISRPRWIWCGACRSRTCTSSPTRTGGEPRQHGWARGCRAH